MAPKVTIRLAPAAASAGERIARDHAAGNFTLVVDAALQHFATLDAAALERSLMRAQIERGIGDRESWILAFRRWLASEFGFEHVESKYQSQYGGYMVVFFMKTPTEYPNEEDAFDIHAAPMQVIGNEPLPKTFVFARDSSPIAAAETLAAHIKANPPRQA